MKRILILIILLLVIPFTSAQDTSSVEVIGGDEADLREFIKVMAGGYGPMGIGSVTVTIGELPDDIQVELPTMDGFTVVGAIQREKMGSWQIWYRAGGSAQDATDAFSQEMLNLGWFVADEVVRSMGGFVSTQQATNAFCFADPIAFVYINAVNQSDDEVVINLNVETGNMPLFCSEEGIPNEIMMNDPFQVLPTLSAPEGVTIRLGGGGGGGGGPMGLQSASTTAVLITEMTAAEILPLYNEQIEAAGWTLVESSGDEMGAWSTWIMEDPETERTWSGVLTLTALPAGEGDFFAMLYVESEG